jgi:hypothetical protein
MKILNRPMFRMGGPIKEGIMNGIQEPKRIGYATKGAVSVADQAKAFENIFTTPQVTKEQVTQFENPAYKENFLQLDKPYMKKYRTKPTYVAPERTQDDDLYYDVENSGQKGNGLTDKTISKIKANIFNMPDDYRKILAQEKIAKDQAQIKQDGFLPTPRFNSDQGATTIDEVIEKKGMSEDTPLTKKERTNNILEMLGYDKAKKNALYDAMINAGQRISRTGLGADNLVSDIIQDTSTVYDKPEKLREAANLMDVQQQLKLDQIDASKTGGATKQSYDFFIEQGYSKEVAERKARNLPTTISEYFTASKASTDTGKLYDATRAATEEGVFGNVEYKGKIDSTKHKKLSEFLSSEELKSKGDGVYNILGEAVIIVDGQVKSRQVIQPKVDKKGWFD